MRLAVLPVLLGLAFAATPAAAQIVQKPVFGPVAAANPFLPDSRLPGPSVHQEVRQLRGQIAAARESGEISAREAKRLDREARLIGRLGRRYGRGGLSDSEANELTLRAAALRARVNRPR